jgi:hypothetical protein
MQQTVPRPSDESWRAGRDGEIVERDSEVPDFLDHGLRVVFCGTAVGTATAVHGHYYSGALATGSGSTSSTRA